MNSIAQCSTENSETVVLPSFVQQTQQRTHNDRQSINKLPTELLTSIFIIGEKSARNIRPRTSYYIGFQEVITHVCHRWREVAIGCQPLWTYIHITRPSPYHLASLYLLRAGPTRHLDIDLEMRKRFWKAIDIEARDWETQLEKVPYLLKFLISHGAVVDRWRSLTVCAKQPEVLYAIIGFVNARPTRALRFFSCRWKVRGYNSDIEELRSLDYPYLFSESYSFSGPTTPNLRRVEFDAIPWGYVFNRPSPIFTGLTKLTLTSSYAPCSPRNLHKLLISNLELEDLSLSISKRAAHEFENEIEPDPNDFHVHLPHLRSLSFATCSFTTWVLCAIERIQAPTLRRLSVSGCFKSLRESARLTAHFIKQLPIDQPDFQDAIGLHLPENVKYVRHYYDSRYKIDHDESDPDSADDGAPDEDILEGLDDDESIVGADSSLSDSSN
ncbi:hypothetical protein OPQ81_008789 [Rhizoctonia solani]|nr:hypothetical protein OPQ81_008789 [Rhizoctonia solani]